MLRNIGDITQVMQQSPPGLLPLFRSETELVILGVLFTEGDRSWQLSALAQHVGLAVSTVSREVARLANADIVRVEEIGRNKLVSANWELPWAEPLAAMLDRTIGPLAHLSAALSDVTGVREAWVYGSWAERYHGQVGPTPRDIDVLVVGDDIDLLEVVTRTDRLSDRAGVMINVQTATTHDWGASRPDTFLGRLRTTPLVRVPLHAETRHER